MAQTLAHRQQLDYARILNQTRRGGLALNRHSNLKNLGDTANSVNTKNLARGLRQLRGRAMKQSPVKSIKQTASIGSQLATKQLLRSAWLALIPSWGLTLIYIDIHAAARMMGSKKFSKVGWQSAPIFLINLLLLIFLMLVAAIFIAIFSFFEATLLEKIILGVKTLIN